MKTQMCFNALQANRLSGEGEYGRKCQVWFQQELQCTKVLLTPSCMHALGMAALLIDFQPGDEVNAIGYNKRRRALGVITIVVWDE